MRRGTTKCFAVLMGVITLGSCMLGEQIEIAPYKNTGYKDKHGRADSVNDLNCNFNSPCCWKNAKPPHDSMEWIQGVGPFEATRFSKNFGMFPDPADGNFLFTGNDVSGGREEKAIFQSCLIKCSASRIQVSVKYVISVGVKLQVCQIPKSDLYKISNCQELPRKNDMKPSVVFFEPASSLNIIIIVQNLTNPNGNIAVIDEIKVDYKPCSNRSAL